MPFPFRLVCDLLQSLDDELRTSRRQKIPPHVLVASWFEQHRQRLDAPDSDACAILSTLLPERRTDRVFFIKNTKLKSIIGNALSLGASRVKDLRRYREPGHPSDLAECVERLLNVTPNPVHEEEITVETIDAVLGAIAAKCRFSSPAVRASRKSSGGCSSHDAVGDLYQCLSPRDAKWFTRLVLKDYQNVSLAHDLVFRHYHPLLPQMLKVRDDLNLTTAFLRHARQSEDDYGRISAILKPKLGVKVGRQPWYKGRSIKHCVDMCRRRTVSCEQKLDGEYCQIHIDRSKGSRCIQMFSKSGKDSTGDRAGVHDAITEALRLDSPDCPFKHSCILEGELVVYSTRDNSILPFHKIRKHVSRSGIYLGTNHDSPRRDYEQLMIVYFDVLLIDNESLLNVKHSERRKRLAGLVRCQKGIAELVQSETISFSRTSAPTQLRKAFASCIVSRSEGLVLKPDEPYFDFSTVYKPHSSGNIKLKKEYVQGWGDVGDFAVIGASYDAVKARAYPSPPPRWTHFYVACLRNKTQVLAQNELPLFKPVNVVELNHGLMQTFQTHCPPQEVPFEENEIFDIDIRGFGNDRRPTVLFAEPLVFDMCCFSFDKDSNCDYWSMRFPTVSKIHFDRSYLDTMTFEDLQSAAEEATATREQEDSQELRRWISGLQTADPRGIAVDAMSSQSTSSDRCPTLSPTKRMARTSVMPLGAIDEDAAIDIPGPMDPAINNHGQGPMTPPRSSAIQLEAKCDEMSDPSDENSQNQARKRSAEDEGPSSTSKRTRNMSFAKSKIVSISLYQSTSENTNQVLQGRSPLGDVGINCCFGGRRFSGAESIRSEIIQEQSPSTDSRSMTQAQTKPNMCQNNSPMRSSKSQSRSVSGKRPIAHDDRLASQKPQDLCTCPHSGPSCALARRSILLSPCIAAYAYVSETLLHAHGVTQWITDPRDWKPVGDTEVAGQNTCRSDLGNTANSVAVAATDPEDTAATDIATEPGGSRVVVDSTDSQTRSIQKVVSRPKAHKICLVESKRKDATAAFLAEIERANLTKRRKKKKTGKNKHFSSSPPRSVGQNAGDDMGSVDQDEEAREWVAVYDWRVLEVITDIESGKVPVSKGDPWRRFWVGLA